MSPQSHVLLAGKIHPIHPTAPNVLTYPGINWRVFTEVSPKSGAGEALGVMCHETEFLSTCERGKHTSYVLPKYSRGTGLG